MTTDRNTPNAPAKELLLSTGSDDTLMGIGWGTIQAMQSKTGSRPTIDTSKPGDYGADPIGDGTFRMVPSGDIVDWDERCHRLQPSRA